MKQHIEISSENIFKIFERLRKKIDKIPVPKSRYGYALTPYGFVRFKKSKVVSKVVSGDKKAINWIKKHWRLKN